MGMRSLERLYHRLTAPIQDLRFPDIKNTVALVFGLASNVLNWQGCNFEPREYHPHDAAKSTPADMAEDSRPDNADAESADADSSDDMVAVTIDGVPLPDMGIPADLFELDLGSLPDQTQQPDLCKTTEIPDNLTDDDCDGRKDESAGLDVQCEPGGIVEADGKPQYRCDADEWRPLPYAPPGINTNFVILPTRDRGALGRNSRIRFKVPRGARLAQPIARAYPGGGFLQSVGISCPSLPPLDPGENYDCSQSPVDGVQISDDIRWQVQTQ